MRVAGQAFTRTGSLYSIGVASVVPFALLSLAVTTRYLGPADYGRLAILFAIASILTVLSGLAVLQGTLSVVYRASDEEGDGDGDGDGFGDDGAAPLDLDPEQIELSVTEKHRLLGSGLLLMMLSCTLWCAPVALLAPIVADVFLGSTSWTGAVLLMTVSAWSGGLWRLEHQVWRVEYRPVVWCLFQALRPLLVVSGTIVALASGYGIEGVLVSTAAGTMLATLVSMFCSRRLFFFRPRREDAPRIIRAGMSLVPIIIARVIQGNVSVLLLALIAPAASVGLFQVASRIAMIPSFFASGYLLGWVPLNRSPIGTAGQQLRGRAEYSGRLFTLLVLILIGLTVVTALGSEVAIRIAAPSFSAAADLLPIVALGAAMHEVFHAYYRASSFPGRRWWYTLLLFIWLFPYALTLSLGGQLDPTYAVAGAQVVASGVVLACMVWLDRRGPRSLQVPWWRLVSVVAVGAACVAAVQLSGDSGTAKVVFAVVSVLAFPLVLRATGLVSRGDSATARSIVSSVVLIPMSSRRLRERLGTMRADERRALEMTGWHQRKPEDAAAALGVTADVVGARAIRGLRSFTGSDVRPTPADANIARYVLSTAGAVERDLIAGALARGGVSLVELHELDESMRAFRKLRRRGLRLIDDSSAPRRGQDPPPALQRSVPG